VCSGSSPRKTRRALEAERSEGGCAGTTASTQKKHRSPRAALSCPGRRRRRAGGFSGNSRSPAARHRRPARPGSRQLDLALDRGEVFPPLSWSGSPGAWRCTASARARRAQRDGRGIARGSARALRLLAVRHRPVGQKRPARAGAGRPFAMTAPRGAAALERCSRDPAGRSRCARTSSRKMLCNRQAPGDPDRGSGERPRRGRAPGRAGRDLGAPVFDAWQPGYANFPSSHPLYAAVAPDRKRCSRRPICFSA